MLPGSLPLKWSALFTVTFRIIWFVGFFGFPVPKVDGQGVNCTNPISLSCGVSILTTTTGSINNLVAADYPCITNGNNYQGEDRIFRLNLPKDDWYDIIVDNLSANLDLILMFNACSDNGLKECLASSTKSGTSSEKIGPIYLRNSDAIFAIVDGINATTRASFRIRLTCYNKPSTAACTPNLSAFNSLNLHDNFEIYTTGSITSKSSIWKKYAANSADASVSTTQAHQGTKSLRFQNLVNISPDLLFPLGNIDHGRYRLQWKLFVVNGSSAYYNIQHEKTGGSWAYEINFKPDGTGNVKHLLTEKFPFKYSQNKWISVTQIIDIDKDMIELFIEGKYIGKWTWSTGTAANQIISNKRLGAINFYAPAGHHYFIDDLCLYRTGCFDCAVTSEDVEVCVYPGSTHANEGCATCAGYTVEEWGANNCGSSYDKVTFEFGHVCGEPMSEIFIPVKVYNFNNITGATFTLHLDKSYPGEIIGMATTNLFGDISGFHRTEVPTPFYFLIDSVQEKYTFAWTNAGGLSYPDGTTLFAIGVKLSDIEGSSCNLIVDDNPLDIAVYQNGKLVESYMRHGSICVGAPGNFIEGKVRTMANEGIKNAYLFVTDKTTEENEITEGSFSASQGYYRINGLKKTDSINVICFWLADFLPFDFEVREGLDLGDLIALQNHVKGINLFNKPEQYIAGDVNRSTSIDQADVIQLKEILLGEKKYFNYVGNIGFIYPWQFIPSAEILTIDKAINHTYKTNYSFAEFSSSLSNVDFIGIKIGDLNFNYHSSLQSSTLSVRESVTAGLPSQTASAQNMIALPLLMNHTSSLRALEMELSWDPALAELVSFTDLHQELNTGTWKTDESSKSSGVLKIMWIGDERSADVNGRLGNLMFRILGQPGEMVPVKISQLKTYNDAGQQLSSTMTDGSIRIISTKNHTPEGLVVFPNPAQDQLNIAGLTKQDEVEYIINALGQKTSLNLTGRTGYIINTSALNPGLYYLITRTSDLRVIKPFIIR